MNIGKLQMINYTAPIWHFAVIVMFWVSQRCG